MESALSRDVARRSCSRTDRPSKRGKLCLQYPLASQASRVAEFERATIRERVKAGMGRVRTELARNGKYVARCSGIVRRSLGRPGAEPEKLKEAMRLLEQQIGILKVAKTVGLGTGTVQKL